ncbi:MAG TPA: trypsin-like peptidase domain-containing protein [Dermatophilaceae bacterium]|nr:trypsin-like peptidase domain-containing protein [Dermatophilaceae bacterium]
MLVGLAAGALAIALVAALLGGLAGGLVAYRWRASTAPALPAMPRGSTQRPAGSIAAIAAAALPSVVTIQVHGQNEESGGTGSGFVLRADGYLLTNNHVVADAVGAITVLFSDGSKAGATVTGKDASYDLAVLKVQRTGLRALALGDSDAVVVGDQVIAVGAPLGLDSTVTSGIVSAVDRPVTPGGEQSQAFINAIQTDAAINPGNSGGPLLDMSGRVIGINSAIARIPGSGLTGQSGNIGVGFAIPSAQARTTAEQLIATGKAQHPIIGVLLDPDYDGPGIKVSGTAQNGREPVTKDGPADRAGLKPGDVITKLDGKAVADSSEFVVAIRAHKVGDRIRITVRHAGAERTVLVTLQGSSE